MITVEENILKEIECLEKAPYLAPIQRLNALAKEVEDARWDVAEKCRLLTKLDKLYIRTALALKRKSVKAKYCHAFKLKNHLTVEDSKGYGSLCIGHSRSPW